MLGQLFTIGNTIALAGWVLLILVPTWRGIAQAVSGVIIPALLGLAYTVLSAVWWSRSAGGFGSVEEVRALFGSTPILVAGWFHYLAFDLVTGAWIARDARREGLSHALVVPALLLTFMVGPIGYIAYLGLRTAWRAAPPRPGRSRLGSLWSDVAARDPVLVATGILFWLAMLPTGLAYALDERLFQGVDVWLKPLKFELSLGLFALTLAWFIPMASEAFRRSWARRYVAWGFALPATFEIVYIAWRASRGEASHFNTSTPVASALYGLMGIGALILTSTAPVLAWGIARNRSPIAPAYRLAVVLGLSLTFVLGGLEGAGHVAAWQPRGRGGRRGRYRRPDLRLAQDGRRPAGRAFPRHPRAANPAGPSAHWRRGCSPPAPGPSCSASRSSIRAWCSPPSSRR